MQEEHVHHEEVGVHRHVVHDLADGRLPARDHQTGQLQRLVVHHRLVGRGEVNVSNE